MAEEFIYEQRHVTVHNGALDEYITHLRDNVWPQVRANDGRVLCLLNGLIGYPLEEVVQIVRFPDIETWSRSQDSLPGNAMAEKEEVRLLRAISERPKAQIPPEDRRTVYGYRRFFIHPADMDEFVFLSRDGVWPRVEAQDARILGLWTTLATTDPLEVILLTGYHGPSHWEATRVTSPKPEEMSPEMWETSMHRRQRRFEISLTQWVCLMSAIEIAPDG